MYMMAKNRKSVNHKASRFRIAGRLALKWGSVVRVNERTPRREHPHSRLKELVERIHPLNELERDAD
jgi:hypothetical protein